MHACGATMKSENIVLMIALAFIGLMLFGLIVQSL
jgi:hypothetical protein